MENSKGSAEMVDHEIADLMFPGDVASPLHWQTKYPERKLPDGAWVTRFAPSPTCYLHMGGLYAGATADAQRHLWEYD
jgi:glutamyl-tRNA synthetase